MQFRGKDLCRLVSRSSPRPSTLNARSVIARGAVPFGADFMAVLQESLVRQSQQMSEEIGIPGLQVNQEINAEGTSARVVFTCDFQLAKFLRANMGTKGELEGAKVLELGCNTGIVGITAAACGANVLITDDNNALQLAQKNIKLNQDLVNGAKGSISAASLSWTNPDEDILKRDWDFVFGSDIMCEESEVKVIAQLLATIMYNHPKCRAKLAHIHRSDQLDDAMLQAMSDAGLILTRVGGSEDDGPDISVFKIARAGQDLSQ